MLRQRGLGRISLALSLAVLVALLSAGASSGAGTGPPANVVLPSITGTAKDEVTLRAVRGVWTGAATISYAYQWERCDASGAGCRDIPLATRASYKLTHGDVAFTLRVTVTGTNSAGSSSATSNQTATVGPSSPAKKTRPKISGAALDGQVLTVSNGTWKGTPPLSFTYAWQLCTSGTSCSIIPGATTSSYRVSSSQIGRYLRSIVTATNAVGKGSAASGLTTKIKAGPPANTALPAVAGSLVDGQTLTAATGTWAGTAPFSFSYQWQRCNVLGGGCENIPGATSSTYAIGAADVASNLDVVVTASNAHGTASATSAESQPVLALLPTNTVLPTIAGLLQDGQLLSVATGAWEGTAPITYTYQWQLCNALGAACNDISGATGSSLKLSPADIGSTLAVVVTATNAAGSTQATSAATELVGALLPSNTELPSIGGILTDGQLLSVATGDWEGTAPITYTYQWQLCNALGAACNDISGATGSSLKLSPADIGSTLAVVVTATNAAGSTQATSAATELVGALLPSNTELPSIGGILTDGQLLSVATGAWEGTAPITYTYQWQLCNALGAACNDISGATGSSLKLSPADIGSTLAVVVTATNAAGSTQASSAATELVGALLPSNTELPSIGGILTDGQLLSVATGSWEGTAPITYTYQWQLCNALGAACNDISGATGSSLKLSPADVGSTLAVVVTATNAAGSTSATSAATELIGALLPKNTSLPSISGTPLDGSSLTSSTGTWSGTSPTYSYQWQLCNSAGTSCKEISGAVGSTLALVSADVGSTVRMVVTATNSAGSTSATSEPSGLIGALLPKNTSLPSISGTPLDGSSLTSSTGTWSGTSPTYSYQWQLCNSAGKVLQRNLRRRRLDPRARFSRRRLDSAHGRHRDQQRRLDIGHLEPSGLIGALLPKNTTLPSISGTPLDGSLADRRAPAPGPAPARYLHLPVAALQRGRDSPAKKSQAPSARPSRSFQPTSARQLRMVVTATNAPARHRPPRNPAA